jgi:hypothetical protein
MCAPNGIRLYGFLRTSAEHNPRATLHFIARVKHIIGKRTAVITQDPYGQKSVQQEDDSIQISF